MLMIGRTIGHYKVLDKLGEGGMGVVLYTKFDQESTELMLVENFIR